MGDHNVAVIHERLEGISVNLDQIRATEMKQWQQLEKHSELLTRQAVELARHGEAIGALQKVGFVVLGALSSGLVGLLVWLIQKVKV